MSKLAQRLQKVQEFQEMPDEGTKEFRHLSLDQLKQCELGFGSTDRRSKKYIQIWEMDQMWVLWCTQHLASSPKLCHKKFLHFVELMVKSAEDHGQKVPVRDPLTGTKLGRSQSTKPANVGEGDDFEVIFDFEDSEDAQTQTNLRRIEAKLVFLEKALRRVTEALNMDPEEQ